MRQLREVRELGLELLDLQISDSDQRLCGKVDDIELAEEDGKLAVAALLIGPGAWPERMPRPFRKVASRLAGRKLTRIPLEEVAGLNGMVRIRKPGADLGLGRGDEVAGRWLARIPGNRGK